MVGSGVWLVGTAAIIAWQCTGIVTAVGSAGCGCAAICVTLLIQALTNIVLGIQGGAWVPECNRSGGHRKKVDAAVAQAATVAAIRPVLAVVSCMRKTERSCACSLQKAWESIGVCAFKAYGQQLHFACASCRTAGYLLQYLGCRHDCLGTYRRFTAGCSAQVHANGSIKRMTMTPRKQAMAT